jgi:hypothetical protein
MQSGNSSNNNNNNGHHPSHYLPPPTTTTTNNHNYLFSQQQQQLQPFNSSNNIIIAASNSAHSSPLRRSATAQQQAVSPLASPMESRRVFMAHQHSSNNTNGGGNSGSSPTPSQQQLNNQMLGAPHPIGAVQLGYAIPACRLLVDPHTGQQFFVPTAVGTAAAPQPLTAAAPTFFQPIYTQPTHATAYYHQPTSNFTSNRQQQQRHSSSSHQQQLISPSSSPPNHGHHHQRQQGPFLYNIGHQQPGNGFYQQQQHSPYHHHHLNYTSGGQHRSQSPLSASPRDDRLEDSSTSGLPYRVEMPPSTVGSIAYNDERRRQSNDTVEDYDVEIEDEQGHRGYIDRNYQHQQQHFQRREHARLSTESRQSNCSTARDSGKGGHHGMIFGSPNNNNSDIDEPSPRSRGYYSSYSPPLHYNKNSSNYNNQQNIMSTSTINFTFIFTS